MQPRGRGALSACQLGNLNQVATGILQHGDGRASHVGRRHRELGTAPLDPLVVPLDVVGTRRCSTRICYAVSTLIASAWLAPTVVPPPEKTKRGVDSTAGSLKMQVRVKLPISGVPEELSNTLTNNAISLQQLGKP